MGGRLSKRKDRRRRGNVGTKPTSGEKCYDPKDRTLTFVDGEDELDCKYNLTFHIPFTIHFLLLLSFIFLHTLLTAASFFLCVSHSFVYRLQVSQSKDARLRSCCHSDVSHRSLSQVVGRGTMFRCLHLHRDTYRRAGEFFHFLSGKRLLVKQNLITSRAVDRIFRHI